MCLSALGLRLKFLHPCLKLLLAVGQLLAALLGPLLAALVADLLADLSLMEIAGRDQEGLAGLLADPLHVVLGLPLTKLGLQILLISLVQLVHLQILLSQLLLVGNVVSRELAAALGDTDHAAPNEFMLLRQLALGLAIDPARLGFLLLLFRLRLGHGLSPFPVALWGRSAATIAASPPLWSSSRLVIASSRGQTNLIKH